MKMFAFIFTTILMSSLAHAKTIAELEDERMMAKVSIIKCLAAETVRADSVKQVTNVYTRSEQYVNACRTEILIAVTLGVSEDEIVQLIANSTP